MRELYQKPFNMRDFNLFLTESSFGPGKLDYAMQLANFDFDFNGTRDTVLRIDMGGDCTQPDFNLFKQRNRYRGMFSIAYYMLTENKKNIDPYGNRRSGHGPAILPDNVEYFLYKGRTFYRRWFGSFERPGNTSDLYNETTGESTDAFVDIYEPRPVLRNPHAPKPYIYRTHVCEIKIKFKKAHKGDKK